MPMRKRNVELDDAKKLHSPIPLSNAPLDRGLRIMHSDARKKVGAQKIQNLPIKGAIQNCRVTYTALTRAAVKFWPKSKILILVILGNFSGLEIDQTVTRDFEKKSSRDLTNENL